MVKNRGDRSTWSYWELLKEDRRWGKYAMQAEETRSEIDRRHTQWNVWGGLIIAACTAILVIIGIVSLLHSK